MGNKILKYQTGRYMRVYIDNMIVKSRTTDSHPADLIEIF